MKRSRHQSQIFSKTDSIANITVADMLSRWPQASPVFLRHRLACVGCSLSRFEQIADVANAYRLNLDNFLQELYQAIEGGNSGSGGNSGTQE